MKRFFLLVVLFAVNVLPNKILAQEPDSLNRDSVIVIPPLLDSMLLGQNIFDILAAESKGAVVRVFQSENIKNALLNQILKASTRRLTGYRIRIYFDNSQSARSMSQNTAAKFSQLYPQISVYPTYVNPFFKVTVGDFRTKSEALKLLKELEPIFKSAFLVKENINYPPL